VRALGPPLAKRSLQSRTLGRLTPTVLAIVRFGIPSAAIRITLARRARPCGVLGALRQASSTRRWSSLTRSGAADAHIETAYIDLVDLSIYFSDATLASVNDDLPPGAKQGYGADMGGGDPNFR